jgi:hypothetical protein
MTERQWLTSTRPYRLVSHAKVGASERKLRLLAVACCSRIRDRLAEPQWRAVEVAEDYADGRCDQSEIEAARSRVFSHTPFGNEGSAAAVCCGLGPWFFVEQVFAHAGAAARRSTERKAQIDLVRDVFGNPFRPVAFNPDWRTDTAQSLANQMYEAREFSAMPILADALQDAGCDSDDLLAHCRDPHVLHVRGCWAVDLVLGKE